MSKIPYHRIEHISSVAPALRSYRRAVTGESDQHQIKQSTYVWMPAFRLALARFIAMFAGTILILAVIAQFYTLRHFSELQWVLLSIFGALVFGAESFVRYANDALHEWREIVTPNELDRDTLAWLFENSEIDEDEDDIEVEEGEEVIEPESMIEIGDFEISFDEADYFVSNNETHFTRGQFKHISDKDYKNFTAMLSVNGYAKERSHRNWHFTVEGMHWLRSMVKYSPHSPYKQRGGVGRARVTPPPPRTPPSGGR